MGFMSPQVQFGHWVEITHDHGSTTWVPAEVCQKIIPGGLPFDVPVGEEVTLDVDELMDWLRDIVPLKRRPLRKRVQVHERRLRRFANAILEHAEGFKDCIESGEVEALKVIVGWGARLSAFGYMDCTDWLVYDSEQEAHDELCDMYNLCDQCGEYLDENGKCEKCDTIPAEES